MAQLSENLQGTLTNPQIVLVDSGSNSFFHEYNGKGQDLQFSNDSCTLFGLNWEIGKDSSSKSECYMFALKEANLFRIHLYFQESLENIAGDLRMRVSRRLYQLVSFLRSTKCNNLISEINISDRKRFSNRAFELAWAELDPKCQLANSEELDTLLHQDSKKLGIQEAKKPQTVKEVLTCLKLDDYSKEFSDEKIDVDDLKYLQLKDLKKLKLKIGDRIKLTRYIESLQ